MQRYCMWVPVLSWESIEVLQLDWFSLRDLVGCTPRAKPQDGLLA